MRPLTPKNLFYGYGYTNVKCGTNVKMWNGVRGKKVHVQHNDRRPPPLPQQINYALCKKNSIVGLSALKIINGMREP